MLITEELIYKYIYIFKDIKFSWFRVQTVTKTIINLRFQLDVGDLLTALGF